MRKSSDSLSKAFNMKVVIESLESLDTASDLAIHGTRVHNFGYSGILLLRARQINLHLN